MLSSRFFRHFNPTTSICNARSLPVCQRLVAARCETTDEAPIDEGPKTKACDYWIRGFHEPDYLTQLRPQIPYWPRVNVRIQGVDWVVLEKFQSYIHKMARETGIKVGETWATPHESNEVRLLHPESTVVDKTYTLNTYERNVQLLDVTSKATQLLIQILIGSAPPGVKLSLVEDSEELQDHRYIPDLQLVELEKELAMLQEEDGLEALEAKKKKEKKMYLSMNQQRKT